MAGLGLVGEMKFAHIMDHNHHHHEKLHNSKKKKQQQQQQQQQYQKNIQVVAGPQGATLLRMNTTKLERLLRHDPDLSSSVSRLAFKGMQDKLEALWLLGSGGSGRSGSGRSGTIQNNSSSLDSSRGTGTVVATPPTTPNSSIGYNDSGIVASMTVTSTSTTNVAPC